MLKKILSVRGRDQKKLFEERAEIINKRGDGKEGHKILPEIEGVVRVPGGSGGYKLPRVVGFNRSKGKGVIYRGKSRGWKVIRRSKKIRE